MQYTQTQFTILQSSMSLMMAHGYERVSIDEVAKRANVSKGAVYYHFSNKIELGAETLYYYFNQLRSMMSFGQSEDPLCQLSAYLDSLANIYQNGKMEKNVCLLGLMALGSEPNNAIHKKTHEYFDTWINALTPTAEKAIANSSLGITPYNLARQIVMAVEGALVLHAADSDNRKLVQSIQSYKKTLISALGGEL